MDVYNSVHIPVNCDNRHDLVGRQTNLELLLLRFISKSLLLRLFPGLWCIMMDPWFARCYETAVCCQLITNSVPILQRSFSYPNARAFFSRIFNVRSSNTHFWILSNISGVVKSFGRPEHSSSKLNILLLKQRHHSFCFLKAFNHCQTKTEMTECVQRCQTETTHWIGLYGSTL